jgi:hypothetical protein
LHQEASFNKDLPMHGDAVLVTDVRAHWVFRLYRRVVAAEDLEMFDGMLSTPRDLIVPEYGNPWIFFHEEPCQRDLVMLKMRWA